MKSVRIHEQFIANFLAIGENNSLRSFACIFVSAAKTFIFRVHPRAAKHFRGRRASDVTVREWSQNFMVLNERSPALGHVDGCADQLGMIHTLEILLRFPSFCRIAIFGE
ncbi:hypothetical protein CEXT_323271 [Caerostris extrusa]|uniref:Uncharacterized protein n=1 Tax=Caerostris extrusa TaxID=172846 RepID=A0AAV4VC87_CAEEX|nr:hypothetical protein CEXT_323271 [Caerostris extrusa]